MDAAVVWTSALDERLLGLRVAGLPWDLIADSLGMRRNPVRERGRRLGAQRPPGRRPAIVLDDPDRLPLPAGHPDCWGMLTAGTVLEGEPYPLPVFL